MHHRCSVLPRTPKEQASRSGGGEPWEDAVMVPCLFDLRTSPLHAPFSRMYLNSRHGHAVRLLSTSAQSCSLCGDRIMSHNFARKHGGRSAAICPSPIGGTEGICGTTASRQNLLRQTELCGASQVAEQGMDWLDAGTPSKPNLDTMKALTSLLHPPGLHNYTSGLLLQM